MRRWGGGRTNERTINSFLAGPNGGHARHEKEERQTTRPYLAVTKDEIKPHASSELNLSFSGRDLSNQITCKECPFNLPQ